MKDWRHFINLKHGHAKSHTSGLSKTYFAWRNMRGRCHSPAHVGYLTYGAKGITVCARWRDSFENFLADMGEKPEDKSLDRIDNSKGYSPENCRWATPEEQSRNRAVARTATINGVTRTLASWAKAVGMSRTALYDRVDLSGMTPEQAVLTPRMRASWKNK